MPKRSSNTVRFAQAALRPYPQTPELVASYEGEGESTPLVLIVQVSDARQGATSTRYTYEVEDRSVEPPDMAPYPILVRTGYRMVRQSLELSAGVSPHAVGRNYAQLVITYGAGAAVRRLVCDLRSGSYQLPPCESARAEIIVYSGQGGDPMLYAGEVAGAFVAGEAKAPARLTHTYDAIDLSAVPGGSVPLVIPDGARWVQAWQADLTGRLALTVGGFTIAYDYDAGTAPIDPVELPFATDGIAQLHLSSQAARAQVRFFLEP